MKKVIRLTESDLHRIVKNSVKRILREAQLNELDPRTYASYAQKRKAQGQYDKAYEGNEKAREEWNKRYGSDTNWRGQGLNYGMYPGFATSAHQQEDNDTTTASMRQNRGGTRIESWNLPNKADLEYRGKFNDKNQAMIDKGERVANQMSNGNGRYVKGKGWQ